MTTQDTYNYFDSGDFSKDIRSPATLIGKAIYTTIIVGAFSGLGMGVGTAIDESLPLDDTPRPGQDEALTQYDAMLTTLAAEYQEIQEIEADLVAHATKSTSIPSVFLEDNTTQKADQYKDMQEQLARLNGSFDALHSKFSTAALIDPRLNEDDVRDIFNDFDSRIGDYTEITGSTTPDFGDINHCRPDHITTITSEFSAANDVKACSLHHQITSVNTSAGVLGGTFALFLFLGFLGKEWAESKNGLRMNAKRRKFKH